MLILYHDGSKVVEVSNTTTSDVAINPNFNISRSLMALAIEYPNEIIVWCHFLLKSQLNILEIGNLFHHRKFLFSYHPSGVLYLDKRIGYVEESPFIKINCEVTYPTWQMSSAVGSIHAEVLLAIKEAVHFDLDFDYFLCSLAKLGMPKGLLCYSEPRLIKQKLEIDSTKTSPYTLFRFVKQHYKMRWVFLLFFNLAVYERRFTVFPFLFSFFYKNRTESNMSLENIRVPSLSKVINTSTVDVIIPTIGRKEYLYDVLLDLKSQSHLPINVIIVEQNPNEGSQSELDFLLTDVWPFKIKHIFTHQAGACNARNVALEQIASEWVFLADDDIRIEADFIEKTLEKSTVYCAKAVTLKCYQNPKKLMNSTVIQWGTFGSGCSFIQKEAVKDLKFKMGYEFGFGEDADFGMQIRNQGCDVLFLSEPSILHLKAPIGGFRTKPVLQWQNEVVQPKPSPTIMLYLITHNTKEQIRGYKTILFFKYYKHQKIKNPIRYYSNFQKQWKRSVFWANELKQHHEV